MIITFKDIEFATNKLFDYNNLLGEVVEDKSSLYEVIHDLEYVLDRLRDRVDVAIAKEAVEEYKKEQRDIINTPQMANPLQHWANMHTASVRKQNKMPNLSPHSVVENIRENADEIAKILINPLLNTSADDVEWGCNPI